MPHKANLRARIVADNQPIHIEACATETERFYQLLEQRSKASGKSVEQLKQEATVKDGLRRLGTPADISALVLFLCSEKARHIQGTAIAVDGGSTVGYY